MYIYLTDQKTTEIRSYIVLAYTLQICVKDDFSIHATCACLLLIANWTSFCCDTGDFGPCQKAKDDSPTGVDNCDQIYKPAKLGLTADCCMHILYIAETHLL